jgi:phage FluMu gp28-like protein
MIHFLPYQTAWITDNASTAIWSKSRRIGATYAEAYRSVERRITLKTDHYFASRDRESAGLFLDDCKKFARAAQVVAEDLGEQVIDEKKAITAFVLRFKNGAKIMALSSNPDVFRGKGGDITLDEFAFHPHPRQVLKAANASAKVWGHQVRIISTHNGEGSLFGLMVKAAPERGWSLHSTTLAQAVDQGLVGKIQGETNDNLENRAAFLNEIRSDCIDQSEWDEEYCCIPSSEANALLSYDLIRACERSADELAVVEDPREMKTNAPLYAGFDVGRQRDLSVFWVLARVGDVFETRLVKQFKAASYGTQEQFLDLLMQQNVRRICIDSTGIGDMLAERAVQKYGHRAEGIQFTLETKAELAMPLVRLFEDRLCRVPADAGVRESLHKVRKIVTSAGNVRFDARHDEDGHADEFWALALAYHAADALRVPLPAPMANVPVGWGL